MFSSRLKDMLSSLMTEGIVRKWFRILEKSRDERGCGLMAGAADLAVVFRFRFAAIIG